MLCRFTSPEYEHLQFTGVHAVLLLELLLQAILGLIGNPVVVDGSLLSTDHVTLILGDVVGVLKLAAGFQVGKDLARVVLGFRGGIGVVDGGLVAASNAMSFRHSLENW